MDDYPSKISWRETLHFNESDNLNLAKDIWRMAMLMAAAVDDKLSQVKFPWSTMRGFSHESQTRDDLKSGFLLRTMHLQ